MRWAALGLLVSVAMATSVAPVDLPSTLGGDESAEARKKGGKQRGKGRKQGKRKNRGGAKVAKAARLQSFDRCESVIGYEEENARRISGGGPVGPMAMAPYPTFQPGPGGSTPPASATPIAGVGAAPTDFSETNVQEQGVDEPDIVKTDGHWIFAIGGNSLHAIDARAAQPVLLDSVKLEGFSHELLLSGSKLLVISQKREIPEAVQPPPLPDPPPPPANGPGSEPFHPAQRTITILTEVDVGNPAAMQPISTQEVDGRYVSARRTGTQARVVISASPAAQVAPPSSLKSQLAGWVPYTKFRNVQSGAVSTAPALPSCEEIERPAQFSGLDMLTVLTVDIAGGLPAVDADGVVSDGEVVYASNDSLYVTTRRELSNVDPEDPSVAETAIHRFDISKPGVTEYKSSGVVRGTVRDQFSLSEHKNVLRVASTGRAIGAGDGGGEESFVSTYREFGGKLLRLGRVGNLGLGEQIQGVRMLGDNAFVVTFRRVDPLYTLDLSNPSNPRVLGELKILGYSAYLHPLGNDRLLGVGADATKEGRRKGAQLSIFDVSDLEKPKRIENRTIAGSRTSVEDTHHAFLFWPPTRLAVVPVDSRLAGDGFLGAMGFRVGSKKIRRVGEISHTASQFADPIERSLVIGGRLFTLSCTGIEGAGLTTLAEQGWVPFPDPDVCRPPPPFPD